MTINWDAEAAAWWIAGTGLVIAFIFLVVGIVALVAYTRVRRQRDGTHRELESARLELAAVREELEEARRDGDETRAELEEVRRQLEHAVRRLAPKLEIHTAKMSELMEMLKGAREDRRRLGELIAGYRKMADKGLGVLKRLVERPRNRGAGEE